MTRYPHLIIGGGMTGHAAARFLAAEPRPVTPEALRGRLPA